jgi:hypothetical protein
MSWTIEIVSVPVAEDADQAWAQLENLREEADARDYALPPSERMIELYRRLTARYPCITEDSASPWSDGPLINNFGDKLTTLGIIGSRLAEALPFVLETATDIGFTVFDAADERIHRPKGWRPPLEWSIPQLPAKRRWWQFWR